MNQSPYNQFEPDARGVPPAPAAPAKPGPRRLLVPAVTVAVVAVLAFGGGFAFANATAAKTNGNGFTRNGQGGPNASGRPGGFGGGTSGTVGSVAAGQMTITTAAGGSKIVLLTPTTTVTKVSSTPDTVSDIASGNQVTVVGTANPDGSVTATSVVLGNIAGFGRGGGFGGGNEASPAPSTAP